MRPTRIVTEFAAASLIVIGLAFALREMGLYTAGTVTIVLGWVLAFGLAGYRFYQFVESEEVL